LVELSSSAAAGLEVGLIFLPAADLGFFYPLLVLLLLSIGWYDFTGSWKDFLEEGGPTSESSWVRSLLTPVFDFLISGFLVWC
jgi:hypothetical protein